MMFGKSGLFGDDDDDKNKEKRFFGDAFHNPNEKTIHTDRYGNRAGYSITNTDNGRSDHYDERGNKVGRSDTGIFGQEYHYDRNNQEIGRSSDGFLGSRYHYDSNGSRMGSTSSTGLHLGDRNSRQGTSYGPASFHPGMVNSQRQNVTQDLLDSINNRASSSYESKARKTYWDSLRRDDAAFLDAPSSSHEEEAHGIQDSNEGIPPPKTT